MQTDARWYFILHKLHTGGKRVQIAKTRSCGGSKRPRRFPRAAALPLVSVAPHAANHDAFKPRSMNTMYT
eukprot:6176883-Pleurochrysis_carterae.AAC.5